MSSFDRFKSLNFTPLDGYKQTGKVLKGAFADLPNMRNRSWLNQVLPEIIWVALIRNGLNVKTFTDIFKPIARILFLNLHINDKNGLSVIWRESFDSLVKAIEMSYGALERLSFEHLLKYLDYLVMAYSPKG